LPLTVVAVGREELRERLRELESRGYSCREDEDGDWECVKPINEIQFDIRVLVVRYA